MDQRLKEAAQAGDVNALYVLIREDAFLLKRIDEVPFIDTPFHISASAGHIEFAMEIMNLKASFARKLNQDGFSPMHLALKNNHKLMVLLLVDADNGLIRVKGRKGMTPLHLAAESGNSSLLAEFFEACPESIKDVTYQGDTALHIAIKHHQMEALQVLLGWLDRSIFTNADFWKKEMLNWRNQERNTALHIAALTSQREAVEMLLETTGIELNIRNSEGLTAIDILQRRTLFNRREIRTFKNRKRGPKFCFWYKFSNNATEHFLNFLTSTISFQEKVELSNRMRYPISSDRRNALIVVDALIATITYQAVLSPPGGVWQGTADINSSIWNNIIHVDNITTTSLNPSRYAGTTVMESGAFTLFWLANTFVFYRSIVRMLTMGVPNPSSPMSLTVWLLLSCYTYSMSVISPTKDWSKVNLGFFYFNILASLLSFLFQFYRAVIGFKEDRRERSRRRQPMRDREEWWQ